MFMISTTQTRPKVKIQGLLRAIKVLTIITSIAAIRVPFKNQCLWPSCSLGNCLMLLETLLYDRSHQGLSFPTKINQIGPCVQILWPKNHQNLDISFGTWLLKNSHKNSNSSKTNCFRVLVMFLNDLPYLIRLGKSLFISKNFSLASGLDFLVCKARARAHRPAYICQTQVWPDIIFTSTCSTHGRYRLV